MMAMADEDDWQDDAACIGHPQDWWFPTSNHSRSGPPTSAYTNAHRICVTCPVRLDCLGYALRTDERHGMWGGATPADRRRTRLVTPTVCDADGSGSRALWSDRDVAVLAAITRVLTDLEGAGVCPDERGAGRTPSALIATLWTQLHDRADVVIRHGTVNISVGLTEQP